MSTAVYVAAHGAVLVLCRSTGETWSLSVDETRGFMAACEKAIDLAQTVVDFDRGGDTLIRFTADAEDMRLMADSLRRAADWAESLTVVRQ